MEFFNVVSVDKGKEKFLENFEDFNVGIQEVDLLNSLDRILAEDIIAPINVPEFNRSTVDGYAIRNQDSHGASGNMPSFIKLIGEVKMGEKTDLSISYGEGVYVPTGGMLPKGVDSVIKIEHTEKIDDDTVVIYKPTSYGDNVIFKGDDIKTDDVVIEKGKRLDPQDIGALASIGVSKLKVYTKPKFYIISTGDEIIDIDEELEYGKVRDINGYSLSALINNLGGEVIKRTIVKDDFKLLREEVKKGIIDSDIVLLSGGSSVGTRDYTYDVINSFDGKGVFIHGVSIKPGKPTIIGEAQGKIVMGLPGHPVSSIIVFKAFIQYFIKKLLNIKENINKTKAIIDFNFHSSPGKETYQMVTLEERNGNLYAVPNFGKSGMITLLSKSQGYVIIKEDEEGLNKGEERNVYFI